MRALAPAGGATLIALLYAAPIDVEPSEPWPWSLFSTFAPGTSTEPDRSRRAILVRGWMSRGSSINVYGRFGFGAFSVENKILLLSDFGGRSKLERLCECAH